MNYKKENHAADAFRYGLDSLLCNSIKPDRKLMHLGCGVYCSMPMVKTEVEQDELTATITVDWSIELPTTPIDESGDILCYEGRKYLQSKKMIIRLRKCKKQ